MWTSINFKTFQKQFDFTSSGQGRPTFTVLKVDDVEFINMVEQLNGKIGDEQNFQTILCDSCGTHHCEPGNWIALRRSNDYIFFIPVFENLCGEFKQVEYSPPGWLQHNGAYWLHLAT